MTLNSRRARSGSPAFRTTGPGTSVTVCTFSPRDRARCCAAKYAGGEILKRELRRRAAHPDPALGDGHRGDA
ncbi:hypothetical protein [Actinomadura sp. 21ATH]|uniref:hypothetical protein n=1 Tax=Actinomadura sp. 21ATH TaxID=1735444 RepID=UPI0035C1A63E